MENKTLLAMLDADEQTQDWFRDAAAAGWNGLDDIADAAMKVHGDLKGFWRCDACGGCVLDVFVSDHACCERDSEAIQLRGDVTLCCECHDAARAARKKIVVTVTEEDEIKSYDEDRSILSGEEQSLARFLDAAEEAAGRNERELIRDYPRDERWQLRRYADADDNDRFLSGKTVT